MRIICVNCKNKEEVIIPKGTVANEYVKNLECDKCGFKSFMVMRNQDKNSIIFDMFDESMELVDKAITTKPNKKTKTNPRT